MMKRMMLCLAVVSIGLTANAQTNSNHLMFGVGALYEKGLDATIAYEHGSKYHNAWEYFVTGYLQYDDDPNAGHVTRRASGITITPGIWALSISHV